LSQITFWGQSPKSYSNEAHTASYLVNLSGGTPYVIDQNSFGTLPVYQYTSSEPVTNYRIDGTERGLWFTEFHNGPPLTIKWGSADITGKTTNTVVGQRIILTAQLGTGLVASSYQWTVPSLVVSDYVYTATSAYKVDLTAANRTNSTVSFCCVDKGAKLVTCSITLTNGITVTEKATFSVKRPTVDSFTSITGPITVSNVWGDLEMSCGTTNTHGIDYTAKVTAPSGFAGDIKFVQIFHSERQRTTTNEVTQSWEVPPWWLDVSDPYLDHGPYAVVAGTQKTITDTDSPGTPLYAGLKKKTANDKYALYLMFKPSVASAIWVPLAKLNWGWTGTAESTDGGTTWTKTSGSQDASNPNGASATEFPEWSDTKTDSNPTWQ
jgi:hypothetical protein